MAKYNKKHKTAKGQTLSRFCLQQIQQKERGK